MREISRQTVTVERAHRERVTEIRYDTGAVHTILEDISDATMDAARAIALAPKVCRGVTATGKPCTRTDGLDEHGYCWQHAEQWRP
jgi:hypothetical protein